MVAGYSWKWVSRRDSSLHDIVIGDIKLKWNSVKSDFINSPNSINEVGCIHTTQGYDLNYTGIIFGNEISYNKDKKEIFIKKENYHDKAGHQGITNPLELKEFIINIYKTLMLRGIKGTYVYVCDKNLREYFKKHILQNKIEEEVEDKKEFKNLKSPYLNTFDMVAIPLVGSVPCGEPLLGENNIEQMIMVDKSKIKPGVKYFILRASGDSMNKAGINDQDLVLCRASEKGETGDNVVALLNGENVTIKYYDKKDGRRILLPKSNNSEHVPIIPQEGDSVQGVVQEVILEIYE
jgi:SOS-response transcriptional repressor LexA